MKECCIFCRREKILGQRIKNVDLWKILEGYKLPKLLLYHKLCESLTRGDSIGRQLSITSRFPARLQQIGGHARRSKADYH
jgi:hypothetical protein